MASCPPQARPVQRILGSPSAHTCSSPSEIPLFFWQELDLRRQYGVLVRRWALELELDCRYLTVGYVELTSGDEETEVPEVEWSRLVRLFLVTLPVVSAAEPSEVTAWGSPSCLAQLGDGDVESNVSWGPSEPLRFHPWFA